MFYDYVDTSDRTSLVGAEEVSHNRNLISILDKYSECEDEVLQRVLAIAINNMSLITINLTDSGASVEDYIGELYICTAENAGLSDEDILSIATENMFYSTACTKKAGDKHERHNTNLIAYYEEVIENNCIDEDKIVGLATIEQNVTNEELEFLIKYYEEGKRYMSLETGISTAVLNEEVNVINNKIRGVVNV